MPASCYRARMATRQSAAVYRRRRIVALVVILLPIALLARACTSSSPAPAPTVTPDASVTTSAAAATTAAKVAKTPTPTPTTETPTPTPTTGDCRNSDINVTVSADATTYSIGSPVTIAMRITNVSKVECKRDVGALANEVLVTDTDGLVIWSSDACQSDAKPQVVVMKPGSVYGNTQTWGGTNSGRDCNSAAPDALAGNYFASARNDTVQSGKFAFAIG